MVKLSRKNRSNRKSLKNRSSRKNRSRKNRRCGMWGGADESLAQGGDFRRAQMQLGGGSPLVGAPVGDTGMLEQGLREMARVAPLDASVSAASAHGQQGGSRKSRKSRNRKNRSSRKSLKNRKSNVRKSNARKNRSSRKNRKNRSSRKSRKNRSSRKSRKDRKDRKSRKSRKMYGGSRYEGSPLTASPMLLTASEAQKAGTADFNNPFLTK